jgi:hypothetical protein
MAANLVQEPPKLLGLGPLFAASRRRSLEPVWSAGGVKGE